MAHPLTQHPSSSLPFAFPPRPSPLAFGFGQPQSHPSPSPSFGSPARPALAPWSTPGQTQTPSRPTPSPSRPRASPYAAAHSSLKRTRRSRSPSGSPPPSPTPPTGGASASPSQSTLEGSQQKGGSSAELAVGGVGQRQIKRSRVQVAQANDAGDGEVDIGIMLATLPPSAHLPILLQLLRANPSLSSSVLAQIPQPDPRSCNTELDRIAAQIAKAAGPAVLSMGFSGSLADARRWERVRGDVDLFCRTATTYIRYITSPAQKTALADISSLFAFLQPLTTHLLLILALVPSSPSTTTSAPSLPQGTPSSTTPATRDILDLAKLILSTWTEWVTSLSTDVNRKGGMHPHSIVSHWADTLDQLAAPTSLAVGSGVFSQSGSTHWSSSSAWQGQGQAQGEAALVVSFREAVGNVRDQFLGQVGWLIGRQRRVM